MAVLSVYLGEMTRCLSDHPVCRRMRAVAAINITHGHAMLLLHAGILHPKILSGACSILESIELLQLSKIKMDSSFHNQSGVMTEIVTRKNTDLIDICSVVTMLI